MDDLSIHIKNFNDRVRAMNQTHSRDLTMTTDIFAVLALVTELTSQLNTREEATVEVVMDGGGFK